MSTVCLHSKRFILISAFCESIYHSWYQTEVSSVFKSPEINHPGDFMFLLSSSCRVVVVINKKKWSKRVLKGVKGSKIA